MVNRTKFEMEYGIKFEPTRNCKDIRRYWLKVLGNWFYAGRELKIERVGPLESAVAEDLAGHDGLTGSEILVWTVAI